MNFAQPPPPPTVDEEIDTLLAALSTGLNGTQSLRRDIAALRKKTTEKEPTLGVLGRPMFFEVGVAISLCLVVRGEKKACLTFSSSPILFTFSFLLLSLSLSFVSFPSTIQLKTKQKKTTI